jgi:7-cyano-7-deazaguanine synthase
MSKVIVPVSGGIDSSVVLKIAEAAGHEIHAISYNYGQRHDKELACAGIQTANTPCATHQYINLSFLRDIAPTSSLTCTDIDVAKTKDVLGDPQTVNYVPNRNMMLLSICTAYAEAVSASIVYHGAALVDSQAGFWDGSKEFLEAINNINDLNRKCRVQVQAPLISLSKKEIIEKGINMGVSFIDTWTCYEGKEEACGECTACSSRIKGFMDAGYIDPVRYSVPIPWAKYRCEEIPCH